MLTKRTINVCLVFATSLYMALLSKAFSVAFAPCEPTDKALEFFCYSTPFLLPLLISTVVYNWLIEKKERTIKTYLKILLVTIVALVICLFFVIILTNIIWSFFESKYFKTDIYYYLFELKCGWDEYTIKDFPLSILVFSGTLIGCFMQWALVLVLKKAVRRVKLRFESSL